MSRGGVAGLLPAGERFGGHPGVAGQRGDRGVAGEGQQGGGVRAVLGGVGERGVAQLVQRPRPAGRSLASRSTPPPAGRTAGPGRWPGRGRRRTARRGRGGRCRNTGPVRRPSSRRGSSRAVAGAPDDRRRRRRPCGGPGRGGCAGPAPRRRGPGPPRRGRRSRRAAATGCVPAGRGRRGSAGPRCRPGPATGSGPGRGRGGGPAGSGRGRSVARRISLQSTAGRPPRSDQEPTHAREP